MRLVELDAIKSVSIILMITSHAITLSMPLNNEFLSVYYIGEVLIGSLAAPTFTFIVGYSLFLSSKKSLSKGTTQADVTIRLVARGAIIFVIGCILHCGAGGDLIISGYGVSSNS